jgi:hypothetical protein
MTGKSIAAVWNEANRTSSINFYVVAEWSNMMFGACQIFPRSLFR